METVVSLYKSLNFRWSELSNNLLMKDHSMTFQSIQIKHVLHIESFNKVQLTQNMWEQLMVLLDILLLQI